MPILRTWALKPGHTTTSEKTDSTIAKNYLAEREIRELNRLTTILLDIFEDQLDIGKLTLMSDAERLLEQQLQQLNRTVLRSGGSVESSKAPRTRPATV